MFESLSPTQRTIAFEKTGHFVVRACPGSGKTYSVAARLARCYERWPYRSQGIAAISFTNVAWQEIEDYLLNDFGIRTPIAYPHFLGTIDSFIDRFIFLPFGHLIMGCTSRPSLVGPPHGSWRGRNFYEAQFTNLTFDAQGTLVLRAKRAVDKNMWEGHRHDFLRAKKAIIRAGFATQDDAEFLAMRLLDKYPPIAQAVVARFPMIVVDEAQDTSEIQMRIIDLLLQNGLSNIALIGDPDQAVFEWNDARPELFLEKHQRWAANSVVLNENRRSSQQICDCTFRLSELPERATAIDPAVRDFEHKPIVMSYADVGVHAVIDAFLRDCSKHGIVPSRATVAVLFRSKGLFYDIMGTPRPTANNTAPWVDDPSDFTKDIALSRYLYGKGDCRAAFARLHRVIAIASDGHRYCSQKFLKDYTERQGFVRCRQRVYRILTRLPETSCSLGDWIVKANQAVTALGEPFDLKIRPSKADMAFDAIPGFAPDPGGDGPEEYRLGTIHSVKGETFEAVLLILKTKGVGKGYARLLQEGATVRDSEELRIVYVGMTRPRRILWIAVPNDEHRRIWEDRLFGHP